MGYGGDNFPRYTIPSIVGRPMLRANQTLDGVELKEKMFGDEANPFRSMLEITHPISEGRIVDVEDFSELWEYTFKQKMNIKTEDFPQKKVLVTEAAMNLRANREKMAEIIFERHNFGGTMFETQALLSLVAEGESTGLVFDSGDGVSHAIPVVDGYIVDHAITRINLAGRHITNFLVKLLMQRGYAFNSSADFETVREIKEAMCFVSYDPAKDRKLADETTLLDKEYTLPDKTVIKIGRERFLATEAMFNPELLGVSNGGFHQKINEVLNQVDIENFLPLVQNIFLTGGTTMTPGLSTRLDIELRNLITETRFGGDASRIKKSGLLIHDPPRRKHSVFIGGSFMAARSPEDRWITKAEF